MSYQAGGGAKSADRRSKQGSSLVRDLGEPALPAMGPGCLRCGAPPGRSLLLVLISTAEARRIVAAVVETRKGKKLGSFLKTLLTCRDYLDEVGC